MIDTNRLLRDAGLTEPAMFRRAVELASQGKGKKEILRTIREDYDFMVDHRVKWQGKSRHYETFGEIGTDIPYNAIEQMNEVMRIPPAEDGALMPDAHQGYAMPIGGVVGLDNAVSPSFVGYDIACRMTLSLLDLAPEELISKQTDIAYHMKQVSSFGLGSMFEVPRVRHDCSE